MFAFAATLVHAVCLDAFVEVFVKEESKILNSSETIQSMFRFPDLKNLVS